MLFNYKKKTWLFFPENCPTLSIYMDISGFPNRDLRGFRAYIRRIAAASTARTCGQLNSHQNMCLFWRHRGLDLRQWEKRCLGSSTYSWRRWQQSGWWGSRFGLCCTSGESPEPYSVSASWRMSDFRALKMKTCVQIPVLSVFPLTFSINLSSFFALCFCFSSCFSASFSFPSADTYSVWYW